MKKKQKKFSSNGKVIEKEDKFRVESKSKGKNYNEAKMKAKKKDMVGDGKSVNDIEEREDIVIGRNAVIEALKGDRTIETLYYYANGVWN